MSSHLLDMSGQRQMQLTMNDPAVTKVWSPASLGDDASLSLMGREIRIPLGGNVRVQKRLATVRKNKLDDAGKLLKENGEYVYEDQQEERLVLVFGGSISGFIRASMTPDQRALPEGTEGRGYEQHSGTTVQVRRRKDDEWDWTEQGELVSEVEIAELLALADAQ